MGIPKTSRKGKKAWRSNISSADVENYFVQTDKEARSGGSLTHLAPDSLFFVDKSKDFSIKRKIDKHRNKVLHCDSILQNNSFVPSIPSSKKKTKSPFKPAQNPTFSKSDQKAIGADQKAVGALFDIWGNSNAKVEEGKENKRSKRKPKTPVIPAVEVEAPGCSFNPSFEEHQDALAVAVAQEMQKVYKKELEPQPLPSVVPDNTVDEEDLYFLDVDNGTDEDLDANDSELNATSQGPRFEPDPLQVLLSEEVTGSIRKLKGCCTLARDRFKSLQKRGYFAPRLQKRRKAKK